MANVESLTGLRGRWQIVHENPVAVCDVGHNVAGIEYVATQLALQQCSHMHIVFGMVDDKDTVGALALLPKDATYYFTQPSSKRALPATQLATLAESLDRHGTTYPTVADAYVAALSAATPTDFIFIGGSCYVIADLLSSSQSTAPASLASVHAGKATRV